MKHLYRSLYLKLLPAVASLSLALTFGIISRH